MEGVRELEAFSAVVFSERFEMDVPPVATPPGQGEGPEAAEQQGLNKDQPPSSEATHPEHPTREEDTSIAAPAEGMADRAWRGFEGVWGRVVGRTGVDEEGVGPGMTG